jgi:UDP-glucose 4-epimerase
MKILITGGTGFIGSHTVVELILSGHDVVIVDNLSNSTIAVLDAIEKITNVRPKFEEFDLANENLTSDFFRNNHDFDGIIHFAAHKYVGESVENPLKYYHNNLFSLINILQEMKKYDIHNIVFSSSCTVYGQPEVLPVKENAPVMAALSPYGNTKQIAEEILRDFTLSHPANVIALRYFNPIGAHDSALIGELPIGVPQNLIPFITQTGIGIRERLSVFGNDYNTPDGTCIRDYIHVDDLAKAHVTAVERLVNNKMKTHFEVFNIGTGNGISVLQVIETFERVSKTKLNYKFEPRRAGDIEQVWAETTLANTELGWKAKKTLEEMVLSAWNWELKLANKASRQN